MKQDNQGAAAGFKEVLEQARTRQWQQTIRYMTHTVVTHPHVVNFDDNYCQ
jgi:hypothetical protein